MEEARHKGHMLYDFIYMKFPEKTNLQKQNINQGFPETSTKSQ